MQVAHGKAAPLRRVQPGDRIAYYSPTVVYGEKTPMQAFTAIGVVRDKDPYQAEMSASFKPFRRDVSWSESKDAPIRLLLEQLAFTAGKRNWAYPLRFGLFEVSEADMNLIEAAMRC